MIKPFLDNINSKIKSRTKEQWIEFAKQKVIAYRAYIQENGEIGFVLAFLLGIFVVVFFRLAFAIFFIAALFAAMVWCLAESEIERRTIVKDRNVENDDVNSRMH